MYEIFIIAIIVFLVVRGRNKSKGGESGGRNSLPNTTVVSPKPQNDYTHARKDMAGRGRQNMQQPTPIQRSAEPKRTAQTAAMEAREDGNHTTAYLMEKAAQDEREHVRDSYEEQQRLNKAYGGLRVAERLYEGNEVPPDKRCVVCGYCAAENLVPKMARERYSCYFCREPL